MAPRTYLYVPGDQPDKLAKAHSRGADALIVDLEDAVSPSRKAAAREIAAGMLGDLVTGPGEVWVRVNDLPGHLEPDLACAVIQGLAGVVVPKVRSAEDVSVVAGAVADAEANAGLEGGVLGLIPMIETAEAILAGPAIARSDRTTRLMIGELDLAAELGIDAADDEPLLPIRMGVVVASAAAGIAPPVGPVALDFRDLIALRESTQRLRRMGFGARQVIHPAQVSVVNEILAPGEEEVAAARALVAAFDAALAAGRGIIADDEGRMIDEAVVRRARRLLDGVDGL
jgi:citrate lyase subunit beta/citryl-CoA lyase